MARTPTLTNWPACLQQRSALSASPLSPEMWMLLDPVKHVHAPNTPTPLPVLAPAACREGVREIPTDAWYTDAWNQEQIKAGGGLNLEQFGPWSLLSPGH